MRLLIPLFLGVLVLDLIGLLRTPLASSDSTVSVPHYCVSKVGLEIFGPRLRCLREKGGGKDWGSLKDFLNSHTATPRGAMGTLEYQRMHELYAYYWFVEAVNPYKVEDCKNAELEYVPFLPLHYIAKDSEPSSPCSYKSLIDNVLKFVDTDSRHQKNSFSDGLKRFIVTSTFNLRTEMATGLPSSDRRGPVYDKVTSFVTNMYIGHYERFHQCPDVLRKGFKGVIEIPYIPLRPSLQQQQQQQQHQHQQQVQRQLSNGKRKAAVRPASSILFAGRMFLFGPERVCSVRTAIAMLASPSLRQEERGFTITVVNMTIPHVELGGKVVDKESVLHAEDAVTSLYLQHSFCIVSKGDSYSTSSLYTAIQSNCIPIVIGDWNVFAFNWIVAYDRFVIRISEENFLRSPERALTEAIRGIVNDKKRLREMRKEMRSWRRILNFGIEPWTGPASNQARKHLMEFSPSFRGIDVSSSGHGGTSTEYEVVLPLELCAILSDG
jgi:hypothetical protein